MLDSFAHFLQKALNHYLALDPESKKRLKKFQGKIVQIELQDLEFNFQLVFTQQGIELKNNLLAKPDTIVKGTPLSLLRMTLSSRNRKHFFEKDVSISGDIELGQQVIDLFDQLEIDWEEYLSKKIGDVPAHQLGRLARGTKQWIKNTCDVLTQNVNEYVHEEKVWFPTQEMLQDFFDEIDTLRMDVDRLQARIVRCKLGKNS